MDVQVPGQEIHAVAFNFVSPNYFGTLGIPIVAGRALQQGDPSCRRGAACPVVISQGLVRKIWPNEGPLGKALRHPGGQMFEVVGIARDVSIRTLGAVDDSMLYLPWSPNSGPYNLIAFVRFSGSEATLARAVKTIILNLDPEISANPKTIQSEMDRIIADLGRGGRIIVFLVAIAFILAVIGIYGVVSFVVAQRTKELGIRIALGAKRRDIYSAVLGSGMRPVVMGLLIGLMITMGAASAADKVFGARPITLDFKATLAYALTAILLAAAALIAMLIPARRATQVDPILTLREE